MPNMVICMAVMSSSVPVLHLLQDSVDIHRVHSDHVVYMLAEIFMQDDMLETWKHGHVPSHNYFSFFCFLQPCSPLCCAGSVSSTINAEDGFSLRRGG